MTNRMKKCPKCHRYTLNSDICPVCETELHNVHPPRFSLQDKFQDYRMKYFREKMNEKFPELQNQKED